MIVSKAKGSINAIYIQCVIVGQTNGGGCPFNFVFMSFNVVCYAALYKSVNHYQL